IGSAVAKEQPFFDAKDLLDLVARVLSGADDYMKKEGSAQVPVETFTKVFFVDLESAKTTVTAAADFVVAVMELIDSCTVEGVQQEEEKETPGGQQEKEVIDLDDQSKEPMQPAKKAVTLKRKSLPSLGHFFLQLTNRAIHKNCGVVRNSLDIDFWAHVLTTADALPNVPDMDNIAEKMEGVLRRKLATTAEKTVIETYLHHEQLPSRLKDLWTNKFVDKLTSLLNKKPEELEEILLGSNIDTSKKPRNS
ncbi:unnamed protein product, partial [Amoebophrya sp. A120]